MQKLSTLASVRRAHAFLIRIPVLGPIARNFARNVFPSGMRLWPRISGGLGKGLWVYVDPRYEMEYVSGKYEMPVPQAVSSYLQPGSVFYGDGAHIGLLSMFAARRVGGYGYRTGKSDTPGKSAARELGACAWVTNKFYMTPGKLGEH